MLWPKLRLQLLKGVDYVSVRVWSSNMDERTHYVSVFVADTRAQPLAKTLRGGRRQRLQNEFAAAAAF